MVVEGGPVAALAGSAPPRAARCRRAVAKRASESQVSGSSSIWPAPASRSGSQNASEISASGRVPPAAWSRRGCRGRGRGTRSPRRCARAATAAGAGTSRPARGCARASAAACPRRVAEVAGRPELGALVAGARDRVEHVDRVGQAGVVGGELEDAERDGCGCDPHGVSSPVRGTRGSRSHVGPGVARPGQVGVVLGRHRPLLGGQRVQVVAVVAVRGAERVVSARHQQHVAVAHRPGLVQVPVAAVEPLHTEPLRPRSNR